MEDTYYFMGHHTYWTYEHTFQDVGCWHESIKNKFNQDKEQSTIIVKEEDEFSSSGQFKFKPNFSIQLKHFDVSVCLVDFRKNLSSTTTTTTAQSGVLNDLPSCSSSIDMNNNDFHHTYQPTTNASSSTRNMCHFCEHCGREFLWKKDLIEHE